MDAIKKAFDHLNKKGYDVVKVEFDSDMRWAYSRADGSKPVFDFDVDPDILESAADQAYEENKFTFTI